MSLKREVFGGVSMAMFPYSEKAASGAVVQDALRKPATDGVLIYFNTQGRLDACVQRIAKAGGAVLIPKLDIGDPGFIATFRDSEGNVVALHQER